MTTSIKGLNNKVTDEDVLRSGIHVFTAVLLLVAVGTSFQLTFAYAGLNLLLITLFAGVYFIGSIYVDNWGEGKKSIWVVALTVIWIVEMMVAPVGIYLVFTLFFVYLRTLNDIQGVVSVVCATAVAIIMQVPTGLTFGGMMGPTIAAVISMAIYFSFRTVTRISEEREVLLHQLFETREQLARSQHDAGVAAERQRLAHEIHDTVAQGLSSIQMLLHAAESKLKERPVSDDSADAAIARLHQARSAASENLQEARAMIAALQPASLSTHSLQGALERMANSFSAAGNLEITVDVEGEERDLAMGTEAALLRIAQGAVGNVVKHAQASRCRVTVTYLDDEVRLDVVDNGIGFDPASVPTERTELGHLGLSAMRQRADEQDGQLTIESREGGPTAVSAAIPDKLSADKK